MKKESSIFSIFAIILGIFLCSCKVSVEDTNLSRKPDIDITEKQVTLIIHKINSETDYINVYRKDTSKTDSTEICIGIVYPQKTDEITYRFIDTLVYEDEKYIYKVRYHDKSGYQFSEWSNEIYIEDFIDAYDTSKHLSYNVPDNSRFYYDVTDYSLTLSGTIGLPDIQNFEDEYQPMLILSYDDIRQVFKIRPQAISNNEPITLRDRIPLTFMDRTIRVEGIVAQKTEWINPDEEDEDKKIPKMIRWTIPSYIKVSGKNDNEITVPSSAQTAGIDYSRKAK